MTTAKQKQLHLKQHVSFTSCASKTTTSKPRGNTVETTSTETAKKVIGQWLNDEVLEAFYRGKRQGKRHHDEIRHSGGQRSVVLFLGIDQ